MVHKILEGTLPFPTISAVDLMMNSGGKTYVYGMVLPHSLPATAVGRINGLDEVRIRIYSHRLMHFSRSWILGIGKLRQQQKLCMSQMTESRGRRATQTKRGFGNTSDPSHAENSPCSPVPYEWGADPVLCHRSFGFVLAVAETFPQRR